MDERAAGTPEGAANLSANLSAMHFAGEAASAGLKARFASQFVGSCLSAVVG